MSAPARSPVQNQPQTSRRAGRPFGLKAIIALLIIQAIVGAALTAFFLLAIRPELRAAVSAEPDLLAQLPLAIMTQSVLAPVRLLAAIGLWRLRRWAWLLTMALLAYSMAVDAIAFFQNQPFYYVTMLLNVIMVFYLNQREVQELFAGEELVEAA